MKLGFKETAVSITIFLGVLVALAMVDDRVRERFDELVSGGNGLSSWSARAGDTGEALLSAARYQSIEHAPLVVFAAVSGVLVLFMLRS
jgi:hypothetical protein